MSVSFHAPARRSEREKTEEGEVLEKFRDISWGQRSVSHMSNPSTSQPDENRMRDRNMSSLWVFDFLRKLFTLNIKGGFRERDLLLLCQLGW